MNEKKILQGIEGGIGGKMPEEINNPTKDDLLILIRWLLRNDSRIKIKEEYKTSSEAYKEADFNVKDVYRMLHKSFREGQIKIVKSLIYYTQQILLPDVDWQPTEILKVVR